jgi:hypothetical protein
MPPVAHGHFRSASGPRAGWRGSRSRGAPRRAGRPRAGSRRIAAWTSALAEGLPEPSRPSFSPFQLLLLAAGTPL